MVRANGLNRARHALISGGSASKKCLVLPVFVVWWRFMGERLTIPAAAMGCQDRAKKREDTATLHGPSLPMMEDMDLLPVT